MYSVALQLLEWKLTWLGIGCGGDLLSTLLLSKAASETGFLTDKSTVSCGGRNQLLTAHELIASKLY